MSIFQKSVLKNVRQDENIVAIRWAEYQKYLEKIDFIKEVKEEKYQDGFLKDIFENCLGYTLDSTNPNNFNLEREKKNETDSKKADGVMYVDNKVIGVIELKAQNTKNLDKVQQQAFWYLTQHSDAKYVIISNFDELRFYFDKSTAYEKFSLFNLDYEEFKKLYLLLSYESIKNDIPLTLKDKSASFEKDISNKLYKDFSLFRTHLFENLVKNNTFDKALLLRLTQKLCDRIIFILFAEDRGLLTANTIKEIRERHQSDGFGDRSMYDYYKLYFDAINKGNEKLNIPKYNGGLFAEDKTLDSLIIDDNILDLEAQALSDYDFMSDVSVNILGHIFEQSLTDLEEINASINDTEFDSKKSKRKKDGVFYTPEYITKYIVDNTLGKLCNDKREELNLTKLTAPKNPKKPTKKEQVTKDNLEEYLNWLLNIKILDPACGSGAFLNQALDFLISEHNALQRDLVVMGDLTAYYEVEKSILENNLYGVDINEDAVEIAKLSLWLRTASKGRELTKLANKIKCGNSLIDDKSVVDNAFVWEEEFSEVFENGGFDIVIGNPPYVVLSSNNELTEHLNTKYFVAKGGKTNLYKLFYEKSITVLKDKGLLGFITPSNYLTSKDSLYLRQFLLNETKLINIVDYPESYNVFENVTQAVAILILEKTTDNTDYLIKYEDISSQDILKINIATVLKNKNKLIKYENKLIRKIKTLNYKISDFFNGYQGEINVSTKKIFFTEKSRGNDKPLIRGNHIGRYLLKQNVNEYCPTNISNRGHWEEERVIFQEVSNNDIERRVNALLSSDYLCGHTTNYFVSKSKEINLKFLLVLLNSKLINYYFKFYNKTNHVAIGEMKNIPIFDMKKINPEPFIEKADLMLALNKSQQEAKQNFINELTLEKTPKKLQNFEELDFEEFVKEYKKAKKLKFADKLEERNFKNDWIELFENDTKIVLDLKEQISLVDNEIDSMVYELYGLSDEEIKIMEGV